MYNISEIPSEKLKEVAQTIVDNTDIGEEGCWWWKGKTDANGYGRVRVPLVQAPGYKWVLTHRLTFMMRNGDLPRGYTIYRICENPMCCNPDHMVL